MSHLFCPQCGTENEPTAYQCRSCGYDFVSGSILVCPICQYENHPGAEQCKQCGTDLTAISAVGELDQGSTSPGSVKESRSDTGSFTGSFGPTGKSTDGESQSDDFEDWLTEVTSEDLDLRSKIDGDLPSNASPPWVVSESELTADTRELDGDALPDWLKNLGLVNDAQVEEPPAPARRKLPEWLHESRLAEIGKTKDLDGEVTPELDFNDDEDLAKRDLKEPANQHTGKSGPGPKGTAPLSRQRKLDEEGEEQRKPDSWLLELAAMGTAAKSIKDSDEDEDTKFVWDDSALVSDIGTDLGDETPDWLAELIQIDDWPDSISEQVIEEWTRKIEDEKEDSERTQPSVTRTLGHTKELSGVPERLVSHQLPVWLDDTAGDSARKEQGLTSEANDQTVVVEPPGIDDDEEVSGDTDSLISPEGESDDSLPEFIDWPDDDLTTDDMQEDEITDLPEHQPGIQTLEEAAEPAAAETLIAEVELEDGGPEVVEPTQDGENEKSADIKPVIAAAIVSEFVDIEPKKFESTEVLLPDDLTTDSESDLPAEVAETESTEIESETWLDDLVADQENLQYEEADEITPIPEAVPANEIDAEIDSDVPTWLAKLTSKLLDTFDNEFVSEWFSKGETIETTAEIDLQDDVEPLNQEDSQKDQIDPFFGEEIPDWVKQADRQAAKSDPQNLEESPPIAPFDSADFTADKEEPLTSNHESALEALVAASAVAGADEWLDLLEDEESAVDEDEEWEQEELGEEGSAGSQSEAESDESPLISVQEVLDIAGGESQQFSEPGTAIADAYLIPDLDTQDKSIPFTMGREQRAQTALLQQLTSGEMKGGKPAAALPPVVLKQDSRLIIASLLLILIIIGWVLPSSLNPLAERYQPAILGSEPEVFDAIQSATGKPILVAFEYTPAMAGEMNIVASTLLYQISSNNSPVIALSQVAAGTAVANQVLEETEGLESYNLGYIPGDAMGLRALAMCLDGGDSCETIYGQSLGVDVADQLDEVELALVLSSDREPIIDWIEQFGVVVDIILIAGVIQPLGPVIDPYISSGQIDGAIVGAQSAAAYQNELLAASEVDSGSIQALAFGQWFTILFLSIGFIYFGFLSRRKELKSEEVAA